MNKSDLVDRLAAEHELTRSFARELVDSVFQTIIETAQSGKEVPLFGFGKFKVAERAARKGRNPRTGRPGRSPPPRTSRSPQPDSSRPASTPNVEPKHPHRAAPDAGRVRAAARFEITALTIRLLGPAEPDPIPGEPVQGRAKPRRYCTSDLPPGQV